MFITLVISHLEFEFIRFLVHLRQMHPIRLVLTYVITYYFKLSDRQVLYGEALTHTFLNVVIFYYDSQVMC
jgi:hypothetical protein